jgi:hypothetical protein
MAAHNRSVALNIAAHDRSVVLHPFGAATVRKSVS